MKIHLKYILLPLLATMVFSYCNDPLDRPPLGNLDATTFYQTETDFEAASLAAYSTMLNFYFDQFGLGWMQGILLPDDDVRNSRGSNDQEEFVWLSNNNQFTFLWEESYKGILRANVVLDRLPEATNFSDDSNKTRFEAEAKFMRAYFYFILARNWGTPPIVEELITDLGSTNIPNSQPGEVWDLIESDFTFAKNNLPEQWDTDNIGRATKWSAQGMLGKVKLFRAQWENNAAKYGEAITEFNEIVSSGSFNLTSDFNDNFEIETENNSESLFEIQMSRGDFNPWLSTDHPSQEGAAGSGRRIFTGASCDEGNCAPGANSHGYGQIHITANLQNEFEPNDPRRPLTIFLEGDLYTETDTFRANWSITGSTPAKYIKPFDPAGFPNNITTNNERILRYADVLLMLAEAELLGNNNTVRAVELINLVRERARNNWEIYNPDIPRPDDLLPDIASGISADEMFDALVHERRVELALECHRYDDLVRWHRAGLINITTDIDFGNTIAGQNWEVKNLLKPIPQRELDINTNLRQNDGYN